MVLDPLKTLLPRDQAGLIREHAFPRHRSAGRRGAESCRPTFIQFVATPQRSVAQDIRATLIVGSDVEEYVDTNRTIGIADGCLCEGLADHLQRLEFRQVRVRLAKVVISLFGHVIDFDKEILLLRIRDATQVNQHVAAEVLISVCFPDIEQAIFVTVLNRCAKNDGCPGQTMEGGAQVIDSCAGCADDLARRQVRGNHKVRDIMGLVVPSLRKGVRCQKTVVEKQPL